ncbi:MAG TPA: 6-carboxytetrahydropterin synthase [Anaerolineales bacterium]|nr:6-carboxytetrahydropterin synthase [Anaerolineales bacterium]
MTYRVAVRRKLIAQHFLIGGDWGAENELHSHAYTVEIQVEAEMLDEHGYLVDIVEIEESLAEVLGSYSDRTLNDLPEFAGLNPSLEHFARILCDALRTRLHRSSDASLTVKVWESDDAWASYHSDS